MAVAANFQGDVVVQGSISARNNTPSSGSVGDTQIATPATPGQAINAAKLSHAHRAMYAQGSGVAAAAAQQIVHLVVGTAGTIQGLYAGSVAPSTGTVTCQVDLWVNGGSILSAPITLTAANTARVPVEAVPVTPNVAAGNVIEVTITPSAGATPALGIFAAVDIWESAQ